MTKRLILNAQRQRNNKLPRIIRPLLRAFKRRSDLRCDETCQRKADSRALLSQLNRYLSLWRNLRDSFERSLQTFFCFDFSTEISFKRFTRKRDKIIIFACKLLRPNSLIIRKWILPES